jgi:hypothetical protein
MLAGCGREPDARTPEQAYAALTRAVLTGRARDVFPLLDLRSRWALMSLHRAEREIHDLVAAGYPAGARERELARYQHAARAEDPAEYFELEYGARIAALRSNLSAAARVERGSDGRSATLVVGHGARIPFAQGDDGRWGWAGLRDELEGRRVWSANALATVRDSVARFRR